MPCYHPNFGKQARPGAVPMIYKQGEITPEERERLKRLNKVGQYPRYMDMPCKKCVGCRLEYSREWANRCMMESLCYPKNSNWFITFTYDNEHVPHKSEKLNDDDLIELEDFEDIDFYSLSERNKLHYLSLLKIPIGTQINIDSDVRLPYMSPSLTEYGNRPFDFSVRHDDIKEFNRKLRREFKHHFGHDGIRFYSASEYGDDSTRPHYHVLYFNLPLEKVVNLDSRKYHGDTAIREYKKCNGYCLYTCEWLTKLWGKGHVIISDFTWRTAAYTARYVMKKRLGKDRDSFYENLGVEPETPRMSRKPGIGVPYLENHFDEIFHYSNNLTINDYLGATMIDPESGESFDLPISYNSVITRPLTSSSIVLPTQKDKLRVCGTPKIFDKILEQHDTQLYEYVKRDKQMRARYGDYNLTEVPKDLDLYFEDLERIAESQAKMLIRPDI